MEKLFKLYPRIKTKIEGNIVRADYLSYVSAVICFLLAGTVFATGRTPLGDTIWITLTAILMVSGIIIAVVGCSQRPKETMLPSSKPATAPIPASPPPPAATTSAPPEEPEKTQEETKPEKKVVRKRRKKA